MVTETELGVLKPRDAEDHSHHLEWGKGKERFYPESQREHALLTL